MNPPSPQIITRQVSYLSYLSVFRQLSLAPGNHHAEHLLRPLSRGPRWLRASGFSADKHHRQYLRRLCRLRLVQPQRRQQMGRLCEQLQRPWRVSRRLWLHRSPGVYQLHGAGMLEPGTFPPLPVHPTANAKLISRSTHASTSSSCSSTSPSARVPSSPSPSGRHRRTPRTAARAVWARCCSTP